MQHNYLYLKIAINMKKTSLKENIGHLQRISSKIPKTINEAINFQDPAELDDDGCCVWENGFDASFKYRYIHCQYEKRISWHHEKTC